MIKRKEANCIDHILRRNVLLRHFIEGMIEGTIEIREDREEDVSRYCMPLRKREYTGG
jgi:hypothetical protein